MSPVNIAEASREFLALIEVLDDAYWEASTIENKDSIYDVLSVFQMEIAELNKLSIQDHEYPYEIITEGARQVGRKLHAMREVVDELVERSRTRIQLKQCLKAVVMIMDQHTRR